MEQDDRAGDEAAGDARGDGGGIAGEGVAAAESPADAIEAAGSEGRGEEKVFEADGGAEAAGRGRAGGQGGGEDGEGTVELARGAGGAGAPEVGDRMGVAVVSDFVTAS